jgi:hypothetical protein
LKQPYKNGFKTNEITSNNPCPEKLMGGLEPALVQVDGQGQDWTSFVAGVGEGEERRVELADAEGEIVEQTNPDVALAIHILIC